MLYFLSLSKYFLLLVFLILKKWIEYKFLVGKIYTYKIAYVNKVKKYINFLIPCKGRFCGRKFKLSKEAISTPPVTMKYKPVIGNMTEFFSSSIF